MVTSEPYYAPSTSVIKTSTIAFPQVPSNFPSAFLYPFSQVRRLVSPSASTPASNRSKTKSTTPATPAKRARAAKWCTDAECTDADEDGLSSVDYLCEWLQIKDQF